MGESTNQREPLLPDRHPVPDFFVCDIFDVVPKGDMASMEHPVFSISTKPDRRLRRYENGGNFIEIIPSMLGLATVHDRDILIFCISQIMAALNQDRRVERTMRFKAHDLLIATNRNIAGTGYAQLKAAFERLAGTRISTNITTGDKEILEGFGLIDRYRIVRETRDGRMQEIEVTLSDWVFNAIRANDVLTISRDYFRLRKPLERRLYELARKHCGTKPVWKIGLELLQKKCGSNSTLREFRRLVGMIARDDAQHGHMPDYSIRLEGDQVVFRSRGTVPAKRGETSQGVGLLDGRTYEQAREAAPGWDVYALEGEWRNWIASKDGEAPRRPGAHFVRFCRSWFKKRGEA